jgi:uncharacterized low-complexity protein
MKALMVRSDGPFWGGKGKGREGEMGEGKREKKRDTKKEEKKSGRDGKVGGIYTQRPAVPIGKINQENHVLI